ncbi:MAG TPA: cyclic nucleotide-binding domain-containing protein, partial [Chloroflexota bacterium]|nr:cyclic nucleotide-binding domain-containing protein [Chloroflexota bacterium]
GAVLVRQGDEAHEFFVLTGGEVEVLIKHPTGQHIVVSRLGAGEYFGEIALLRGGTRTATVRATMDGPVEVMTLDRETYLSVINESEEAKAELDQLVNHRLGQIGEVTRSGAAISAN